MTSTQPAPERPFPERGLLQRALAAYRVNSSPVAVVLLVLFNLVPLAGVLWLGWDLLLILALLVLIVGKTALDLAFHLRQHQPSKAVPVPNA